MPNIRKIVELSFFIIVNIFISAMPVLYVIYNLSNLFVSNTQQFNPATTELPYLFCFLIFWVVIIVLKVTFFPFLFKLKKFLPYTHIFFIKFIENRKLTGKLILYVLLADILLNGISYFLLFKDVDIYDLIINIVGNFLFGGGVGFCYLSLFAFFLNTDKKL